MLLQKHILSDIESRQYIIRFAKTEKDIESALRLRHRIFKKELQRQFDTRMGLESDRFDEQSHHLLVIDRKSGQTVGTYRLQSWQQARSGYGFYSEKRFAVEQLPDEVLNQATEVGRACIHKNHRNGRVLYLLWKGFAGYLTHFDKRYLFGYNAMTSTEPAVLLHTFRHFREQGYLHNKYLVDVRAPYRISDNQSERSDRDLDIPPLLKNYLDVGSKICSPPSLDRENELAHIMILLDKQKIPNRVLKLFFE